MSSVERVDEIELRSITEVDSPSCRPPAVGPAPESTPNTIIGTAESQPGNRDPATSTSQTRPSSNTAASASNSSPTAAGTPTEAVKRLLAEKFRVFLACDNAPKPRPPLGVWTYSLGAPFIQSVIGVAFVVLVMTFYLVPMWRVTERFTGLKVALVNTDKGFGGLNIGSSIVSGFNSTGYYDWVYPSATTTYDEVLDAVQRSEDYWSAVFIPSNFTEVLYKSYVLGTLTTYDNMVWVVHDEVKSYSTNNLVKSTLGKILDGIDRKVRSSLLAFAKSGTAPLASVITPVPYTHYSVHTIDKYGWYFGVYIVFVAIWLALLVSANLTHISIHHTTTDEATAFKWWQVVALRAVCLFCCNTAITLAAAIYLEAYGYPHANTFGCNWLVMWLSGFAFVALISVLLGLFSQAGMLMIVLVLIFQLATCDGIYNTQSLPGFFRALGPVFPFQHSVRLFRISAFGSKAFGPAGYHIGILFVWLIVCNAVEIIAIRFEIGKRIVSLLPQRVEGVFHLARLY